MKYEASLLAVSSSTEIQSHIFISKSINNNSIPRKWSQLTQNHQINPQTYLKSCILGNFLYVFYLENSKLYYCLYDGNNWSTWVHIGNLKSIKTSLFEALSSNEQLHIFCSTAENELCIVSYDGKTWREQIVSTRVPKQNSALSSSGTIEENEIKIFYTYEERVFQIRSSDSYKTPSSVLDSNGKNLSAKNISTSYCNPLQLTILACDKSVYILTKNGTAERLKDEEFIEGTITADSLLQEYSGKKVAAFYSGTENGIFKYFILEGKIFRTIQDGPTFPDQSPILHFAWFDLKN